MELNILATSLGSGCWITDWDCYWIAPTTMLESLTPICQYMESVWKADNSGRGHNTIQYNIIQYSTCSTVQYHAVHNAIYCSTMQYIMQY